MNALNVAVAIAWRVHGRVQVGIDVEERLYVIVPGRQSLKTCDWENDGRLVNGGNGAGTKVFDVARKHRRRTCAGLAD